MEACLSLLSKRGTGHGDSMFSSVPGASLRQKEGGGYISYSSRRVLESVMGVLLVRVKAPRPESNIHATATSEFKYRTPLPRDGIMP